MLRSRLWGVRDRKWVLREKPGIVRVILAWDFRVYGEGFRDLHSGFVMAPIRDSGSQGSKV